jgi:acetolactate synthase I/II/III large subunit
MSTVKITGAEAIIKSLAHLGVTEVFGYPGGAIMPTYDALFENKDNVKHILVRHEQAAVLSAAGYSRMSDKVGVCLATSGPGATNLITGIADAMLDSVPVVCITGQVASHLIGTDAFQEADIIGMTVPITKWNYQINNANEIPHILAKAMYVAGSGRPGPVLIDITKDAQFGELDFDPISADLFKCETEVIEEDNFIAAAKLINESKKPYIFSGHGISIANAENELITFAEKTGIPVACTLHGLSTINSNHKLYAGMLGMHGNYASNLLTNEADLIIAIGMRFDDRVTGVLTNYAKQAKIIHIDIDIAEINKNVKTSVAICGDAKNILIELIKHVKQNNHDTWINEFKKLYQKEYDIVIKDQITPNPSTKIKMAEVIRMLSDKTHGGAVIVSDVGQHQMIAARYYEFAKPKSHITSGGLGTMGFSLPTAIGAKFGAPEREVIAVIGDGGFQMNIQELGVLLQEKIAVKIIILNNEFLGMVRQWQEMFFEKRYSFTNMINPDFIKVADAYGIEGLRIDKHEDLPGALDKLLSSESSFLLEVMVEKEGKVFPMMPSGCGVADVRLI